MRDLDRELWDAVDADDEARVAQLLRADDVSTALQDDGQPILTSARSAKVYQLLRRFGAIEPPLGPRGATPLIRAAERGDTSLLQLLLDEGADPYARDGNGNTAIDRACA